MNRPLSIAELAALAADTEDQTETVVAGEYERELIPAGPNFARFVEYIEIGKHPRKAFQGKEKTPAEKVRLTFELLHPKSIVEYEDNGQKKKRGQNITISVTKGLSDKGAFKKIFNLMTYGRADIKHFAQMLGQPFLVHIHHNVGKDAAGKEITYANLNNSEGVYSIGAPRVVDPITEVITDLTPHIPEPFAPIRLFLWNNPTKETWDSLFIDGTREVKGDKGEITHVSKNWLQELMMSSIGFDASPTNALLHAVTDLPTKEPEVDAKAFDKAVDEYGLSATEKPASEQKAANSNTPAPDAASAALAAMGLVG